MKRYIWIAIIDILGGAAAAGILITWAPGNLVPEPVPEYPGTKNTVWLDQNWTEAQRNWFHHADQGTQTFGIPYEWFVALEQPDPLSLTPGLLCDPSYLDRYGFIPDVGGQ